MFFLKCFTFLSLCFLLNYVYCQEDFYADIFIKNVERSIDISTQLCKVSCILQLENIGKSTVDFFFFTIEPAVPLKKVAFISARSSGNQQNTLNLQETKIERKDLEIAWKIKFKESLAPGSTATVEVEYILIDVLSPFPTSITQKEKQLIRYYGNHFVYLPYASHKQITIINLGTKHIESYSKLNPYTQSETTISYGPYLNVQPFSYDKLLLHYENNSPFLKVLQLIRKIEVSHWGNVAIEETIDIVHTGATLKGSFSRYDFQREAQSGLSSVKSFKTVLPASATDAYYRDDIGNISTSHMKVLGDSVELDLRPRFPLFGGWKTHYVLGYNVPSYEYLFSKGDNYKLKMRILDHIFDDMIIEELITKIILPEGSENIHIKTPYPMVRLPDSRHSTYLDTKGRPVIAVAKSNLVENHIQEFEVDYVFPKILMLQEPLLVTIAFYILFLLVIFYVRLDLSISKDEVSENKLRVSGLLEKVIHHLDKRANTYHNLEEQLSKLKNTKDVSAFTSNTKSINQDYKNETNNISELITKIKPDSPEIAEKILELQKLDKDLKECYSKKQTLYTEKLVPGKINRNAFMEAETLINKRKEEITDKINVIIKNLH